MRTGKFHNNKVNKPKHEFFQAVLNEDFSDHDLNDQHNLDLILDLSVPNVAKIMLFESDNKRIEFEVDTNDMTAISTGFQWETF